MPPLVIPTLRRGTRNPFERRDVRQINNDIDSYLAQPKSLIPCDSFAARAPGMPGTVFSTSRLCENLFLACVHRQINKNHSLSVFGDTIDNLRLSIVEPLTYSAGKVRTHGRGQILTAIAGQVRKKSQPRPDWSGLSLPSVVPTVARSDERRFFDVVFGALA